MANRYDIGIIGAGVSGICAAIQLQQKLGTSTRFTLFEKNTDVGGTRFNNVYPAKLIDISFAVQDVRVMWLVIYTAFRLRRTQTGPQTIHLKNVTTKYKLHQHIKFQHEVKTVTWNEELMKWTVKYIDISVPNADEETQMFDIIINAPGALRVPYTPDKLKTFTGPTIHTAEWNNEIDLKNKNVAVIGSGASAVQVIPSIVDNVSTLHCYQRKPPYILPRLQFKFPTFIKNLFFYFPFLMWIVRCFLYFLHELLHNGIRPGTVVNKFACLQTKLYRQSQLKDHKHLWDDATPKYSLGCKRIIVSEQYYPAMARSNVRIHTSHIEKIVDQTIYTKDGSKEDIDVLVLATGFRVREYFGPMQVFGKSGENILKSWMDDRPRSFYGVTFSTTPNLFYLFGPNTVLGHSSVIFMIECQVNFTINAIREMRRRNAKVINTKVSAEDEFMNQLDVEMKKTVWGTESCGSWYANPKGDITILWADNCTSYWRQTRNIDWSKFDFI